jgi:hypothetical protein
MATALPHSAVGSVHRTDGQTFVLTKEGEAGCVLYGPYIELPPGKYAVAFQISPNPSSSPFFASNCGHVDVCADTGKSILAHKSFSNYDLAETKGQITICFETAQPETVEFRVFANGHAPLKIMEDRELTMSSDHFGFYGTEGPATYRGFFLQHLGRFKDLASQGAIIKPTTRGADITHRGITMEVRNVDDFQIVEEIIVRNDCNFYTRLPVCVLDIGMNVGLASLYFANLPSVREVHSF